MKKTLQICAILAGLHLIAVVFHQMLMFQHELPYLDDRSLPSSGPADTLLGSGAVLWVFHPLIAALITMHLDSILPAALMFVCDSMFWALLALALACIIRNHFRRRRSNALNEKPGNA